MQVAISDNLTSGNRSDGLTVSDSNQNILKELITLKAEYAEKISKYKPSSKVVIGLKKGLTI